MNFVVEQRYYSRSEPELGLGNITKVENKNVSIFFPARDIERCYEIEDAPLTRAKLSIGATATNKKGHSFTVTSIREIDFLYTYYGENDSVHERDLSDTLDLATPENRFKSGQSDHFREFDLRLQVLKARHQSLQSKLRGFLGGKIQLFPHQLYIAQEVCHRHRIRILLADEVGLGKTIEAILILHRLLLNRRVSRAIILTPPSLIYQWYIECYLRFHLSFEIISEESIKEWTQPVEEQLMDGQLYLCPMDLACSIDITKVPWDMIIVDEAHHIESHSEPFQMLKNLAKQVEHILLLSATPEQEGEKEHFKRLQLLDPAKFHTYTKYTQEKKHYQKIAITAQRLKEQKTLEASDLNLIKSLKTGSLLEKEALTYQQGNTSSGQQLLNQLIDYHGIGRLMFRNVRAYIGGFPKRILNSISLEGSFIQRLQQEFEFENNINSKFYYHEMQKDPRTLWLKEFLIQNPNEKILVICYHRLKVEAISKALEEKQRPIARFHEEMSLIERDRQVAWFKDAEGPQLLISSSIGAEGRNFQFAKHMVLLDLPIDPEQLEQRIGRLDRIGQGEEIFLHVPYFPGTPQERLLHWHENVYKIFQHPWHGSNEIVSYFKDKLFEHILHANRDDWNVFIKTSIKKYHTFIAKLEKGRDRLLEYNSFQEDIANEIASDIFEEDQNRELEELMLLAFDRSGIDSEEVDARTYKLRPNLLYTQPFPGFKETGMLITFDRKLSLEKDSSHLLTWDHPMVRDSLQLFSENERGNASIAKMPWHRNGFILEVIYIVESTLPLHLRSERFFPPTPIHIRTDDQNQSVHIRNLQNQLETFELKHVLQNEDVMTKFNHMLKHSLNLAQKRVKANAAIAVEIMKEELEPNLQRLLSLSKINPSINQQEIDNAKSEIQTLENGLQQTQLRLDALRFIACYQNK